MKKVFLDLEMNPVPNGTVHPKLLRQEIIEIGAVMFDEEGRLVGTFCEYVRPQLGPSVSPRIRLLTGISDRTVREARSFSEIITLFLDWCGTDSRLFCWSENDALQLMHEASYKKYHSRPRLLALLSGWEDVQKLFGTGAGIERSMNLGRAASLTGLEIKGRQHDALDDARTTAELYYELTGGRNIRRIREYMTGGDSSLCVPMGDLMPALSLSAG